MTSAATKPAQLLDLSRFTWLTSTAFYLALAVALARAITIQFLRDPSPMLPLQPGEPSLPIPAGPASSQWLDVLCLISAALVLLRRVVDTDFQLRPSLWLLPVAALGGLAMLSARWAVDSYAAYIGGSQWLAMAAVMFTLSQTIDTWQRLRFVVACGAGLLVANVIAGVWYYTMVHPATVEDVEANLAGVLASRRLTPGTPAAEQFLGKVRRGDYGGFGNSPNTFAITLASTAILVVGLAWQRVRERSNLALAAAAILPIAAAAYLLSRTGGKAAIAAGIVVLPVLFLAFQLRRQLAQRRKLVVAGITVLILLGVVGVIGVGVARDGLPTDSLRFRWQYWVGAWQVFLEYPLRGVGFANFGDFYLEYRLPSAVEEVKDPHSLPVRVATELGVIGLALLVAGGLMMLWHVSVPVYLPQRERVMTPKTVGLLVLAAGLLHALAAIDFTSESSFVLFELIRVGILLGGVAVTVIVATSKTTEDLIAQSTSAPFVLLAAMAACGALLLHALVDFALFEAATMFTFAVMLGAATAGRTSTRAVSSSRAWPAATLATTVIVLGFVFWQAVAVTFAEATASQARRLIEQNDLRGGRDALRSASNWLPFRNAQWYRHEAIITPDRERRISLLTTAHWADRRNAGLLAMRAGLHFEAGSSGEIRLAVDLLSNAVKLDPRDRKLRQQFAAYLEASGQIVEAIEQLEHALWLNEQLSPDEMERYPADEVAHIREEIARLKRSPGKHESIE